MIAGVGGWIGARFHHGHTHTWADVVLLLLMCAALAGGLLVGHWLAHRRERRRWAPTPQSEAAKRATDELTVRFMQHIGPDVKR